MKSVAMLLSADSFEKFFGGFFDITAQQYVETYRNDFAWYYALSLARLGHRTSIYVLAREADGVHRAPEGVAVRFLRLPHWWRLADALLYRLQGHDRLARLRARIEVAAFGRALRAALEADAIDVLYVQEIWTDRIDHLLPIVPCEMIGSDHGAPARTGSAAKRELVRALRKITVQNEAQRRWIMEAGGDAVVIHNGIDTAYFAPGPEARERTVLAVGRLVDAQKRFSDLIRAIAALPDVTLHIVGAGPDQAALTALAAKLGLTERVVFHGFVSDRGALRAHYRRCGVFCCPSAWEATALVLLEAMGCGAPCVVSDIPTFREVVTEGAGLLVPVGDTVGLAAALRTALDQPALGHAARARVAEGFDQEAIMRRLSALIEA